MFRYIKSQSGSALMQAMLGMGLVGIVSYSVMSYQTFSSSENRIQFAQNDIDSTAQLVSSLVAIPALCNSNLNLRNNFVRPANLNDPAADIEAAINLGIATTARPAWANTVMGAAAGTSVPGAITEFNVQIDRVAISGARLKRNLGTNQIWAGDVVISAQKTKANQAPSDSPNITGRRIVGTIELEINPAGEKINCSTSASVATICRDLGGVYDQLGTPNCVFAMRPMDCNSIPDGYVHDIDGSGNAVCRSATAVCPPGYFANGITDGALNCTRLSRRIVYAAAPPTPSCLAEHSLAGALYGTCVGNPSNIAEIRASCCSGTTYAVCDASSDKLYYCGTAATPPAPAPDPGSCPTGSSPGALATYMTTESTCVALGSISCMSAPFSGSCMSDANGFKACCGASPPAPTGPSYYEMNLGIAAGGGPSCSGPQVLHGTCNSPKYGIASDCELFAAGSMPGLPGQSASLVCRACNASGVEFISFTLRGTTFPYTGCPAGQVQNGPHCCSGSFTCINDFTARCN